MNSTLSTSANTSEAPNAAPNHARALLSTAASLQQQLKAEPKSIQDEIIRINTREAHRPSDRAADPDPRRAAGLGHLVANDAAGGSATIERGRGHGARLTVAATARSS
jgi:hypothetical protein